MAVALVLWTMFIINTTAASIFWTDCTSRQQSGAVGVSLVLLFMAAVAYEIAK